MAKVKMLVLFNGTGQSDKSPYLTNIVKIRDGLQTMVPNQAQTQWVFYADGIANDKEHSTVERAYESATGATGKKREHEIYRELKARIEALIENGSLKIDDEIDISVAGFSRGAAQARDFGNAFLRQKLTADLKAKYGFSPTINYDAAYLFDTVGDFELAVEMPLVEEITGIDTQQLNLGFDLNTNGIRVVHLLALDEKRKPFTPTLANPHPNVIQVICKGDHSTVGGGHPNPDPDTQLPMADIETLQIMVLHMREHGFVFKPEFIKQYQIDNFEPRQTAIHDPKKPELWPAEEWGPRDFNDKRNDSQLPWISESVIKHMESDPNYRPAALKPLKEFYVYKANGDLELYSADKVAALWQGICLVEQPQFIFESSATTQAPIRKIQQAQIDKLPTEDHARLATSDATRLETPLALLYRIFSHWFSRPAPTQINAVCVPNPNTEEGGLLCQTQYFNAHVSPKQSPQDALATLLNTAPDFVAGDTYNPNHCQGIEYAGKSAMVCEGQTTTAVLTDYDRPKPFEQWGANFALAMVLGHAAKNMFDWAKDKLLNTPIQQPKGHPIGVRAFNNATHALQQKLQKCKANIEQNAQTQPPFFVRAVLSDIDNFLGDIAKLQRAKKVTREQVNALRSNINYFTKEMAKEFYPVAQQALQANQTRLVVPTFESKKQHPTATDYGALMVPPASISAYREPPQRSLRAK